MAMKLALCYLKVTNLGDLVIYDTAHYLVERILRDLGRDDVEIVPVNIGTDETDGGRRRRVIKAFAFGILRKTARVVKKCIGFGGYLRWQWHKSPVYRRYAAEERKKLLEADMIVFAGGGLVKFHRQNFHFFVDDITALADVRGVPVVFNAVGVEGFSAHDGECRLLRRALKRRCVKAVTTRDDLDMLIGKYGIKPEMAPCRVCDPAFWVYETYGVARVDRSQTVGLNVIRPTIFSEYTDSVNRNAFMGLYADIIRRLLSNGWRVEMFSNGVLSDSDFIKDFMAAYPEFAGDARVTTAFPSSAAELVRTIAGYARFVAVRLHAAIVGSVLGVPNVSLVWNRKQPMFGAMIGMPGNFIGMDGFDAGNVVGRLLAATPYQVDEAYKNSVLESLREAIGRFLPAKETGAAVSADGGRRCA